MSGNKKQPLVPRLRFPEFREAEEWKLKPLGKLAKRRTVKNVGLEHTRVLTNSAEFGVLDQRDYFEKDIANQGNLEGYYIVEKGDYVYNPRISASAPVGPISKNNVGAGVMSPLYTVFRFDGSNNDFFAHYFKSTHWHQYMRQASSTGARHDRMSITNDDFMGLPLPVSKPEEQQKIADCLSSLDDLIAAETQKLDTLKTHKKGLMQQLFPREGETVPRLRFPEFREEGEWAKKSLADVCLRITNGKANAEDHEEDGVYPLFDRSEVIKKSSDFAFDDEAVIIPGEGMRFQPKYYQGKFNLHQRAYALMQHKGVAKFVYYTLDRFKDTLAKNAVKSTVLSLRLPIIEKFGLAVPNKGEQQKIADCLSSLDDLITAETQKLDTLKTHKKGLMQQLFPTLNEVGA